MREYISNITYIDILRFAESKGDIFYFDENDSLGTHQIDAGDKSFSFHTGQEKAHAKSLINELLVNQLISHKKGLLYQVTSKGYEAITNPQKTIRTEPSITTLPNEDILDFKPNLCGFGINLNALYRKIKIYRK